MSFQAGPYCGKGKIKGRNVGLSAADLAQQCYNAGKLETQNRV
jgi:hypothetical protein